MKEYYLMPNNTIMFIHKNHIFRNITQFSKFCKLAFRISNYV